MNKSFPESKIRSELTSMIINRGKTMACRTDLVRLRLRTVEKKMYLHVIYMHAREAILVSLENWAFLFV